MKKRLTIFICLFCFLFSVWGKSRPECRASGTPDKRIPLTPSEIEFVKAHPEIRVTNEFDWPPFDFMISGKPAGFGIELMSMLADRVGLEIKYINGYTWDELIDMFFAGQIDVIHSLSLTPERREKALFSHPYYHSKNVIIMRNDTKDIHSLDDLSGRIIALPSGWSSIEFFKTYYPGIHIIEVESTRQSLEYIDQGKVAATVEQEGIVSYFIKKFGFHDLKLSAWIENEILQQTSSMHFAVLKNNPELFNLLSKALISVTPQEMNALKDKWLSRSGRQMGKEDVGLTPKEQHYLKQKGQIRFCAVPERLPFEAVRGEKSFGMLADFSEIFSERLNTRFSLVPAEDIQDSIQKLEAGVCDIIPMVKATTERKKTMDFTSPYLNDNIVIIAREKLPFISGLEDMADKRVGIVKDESMLKNLEKQYSRVHFILRNNVRDSLIQLSSGKMDAVLLSLPVATHNIRHLGLTNLKVAGDTKIRKEYRVGVKNGDEILHSVMSKLIRSISKDEIDTVYDKWVTLKFQHEFDYTKAWKYGGFAGLILILILFWNWKLTSLNRQLEASHKALKILSTTDSLTGLYNRRYLEKAIENEFERAKRYKTQLSVIILDVDHFKAINDDFGHQAGDDVLMSLARLLKDRTRKTDITGRWGGEEFVIFCPETDREKAVLLAESLKAGISGLNLVKLLKITASFGVSTWKPDDTVDSLISRADAAMYQAKHRGRNRVVSI